MSKGKPSARHGLPFGMTPAEVRVMDAYVKHGSAKVAAHLDGINERTLEVHMASARDKMQLALRRSLPRMHVGLTWYAVRLKQGINLYSVEEHA